MYVPFFLLRASVMGVDVTSVANPSVSVEERARV